VIDDGIATGATMRAALQAVRRPKTAGSRHSGRTNQHTQRIGEGNRRDRVPRGL
jgi:hypothetical protein